eukprot:m.13259 g.13259  ORF g.13259 m.13259 type:complete len:436 (-) comp3287_c0_seq1:279-1586(-)
MTRGCLSLSSRQHFCCCLWGSACGRLTCFARRLTTSSLTHWTSVSALHPSSRKFGCKERILLLFKWGTWSEGGKSRSGLLGGTEARSVPQHLRNCPPGTHFHAAGPSTTTPPSNMSARLLGKVARRGLMPFFGRPHKLSQSLARSAATAAYADTQSQQGTRRTFPRQGGTALAGLAAAGIALECFTPEVSCEPLAISWFGAASITSDYEYNKSMEITSNNLRIEVEASWSIKCGGDTERRKRACRKATRELAQLFAYQLTKTSELVKSFDTNDQQKRMIEQLDRRLKKAHHIQQWGTGTDANIVDLQNMFYELEAFSKAAIEQYTKKEQEYGDQMWRKIKQAACVTVATAAVVALFSFTTYLDVTSIYAAGSYGIGTSAAAAGSAACLVLLTEAGWRCLQQFVTERQRKSHQEAQERARAILKDLTSLKSDFRGL